MGVKERMWRVIKKMNRSSRSAELLEGEKSDLLKERKSWSRFVVYPPYYFQYS